MRIEKPVLTKDLLQKLLLGLIVTVLFFYVDLAILKGQLKRRSQVGAQVKELRANLAGLRAAQARISAMSQSQLDAQKARLAAGGRFVSEDDIVAFLQSIAQTAERYRIKINHMRPAKDSSPDGQGLRPLTITLDGIGEFHNAVSFVHELEAGVFFLTVQVIRVTPQADMFRQKFHLVIKTYVN
jgi:hypothetical protein